MKTHSYPLISIVIPVYNGADYVAEAINSALAQDYPNFEVIVVNDGSKDDGATDRICKSFGDRIRYISKENGGVSTALNEGIANMSGEYFSWLSHDDKYATNKLSESYKLIKQNLQHRTIAMCGTSHIDSQGKPLKLLEQSVRRNSSYTGMEMFEHCFIHNHSINGSGLLIPKQAFDECGGFSDLKFSQDLECWSRMMMMGYSFVVTPKPLSITRIHAQQGTNKMRRIYFAELPEFYDRLYRFAIARPREEERMYFLKVLLLTCYTNYSYSKNTIREIERTVRLPWLQKTMRRYRWSLINSAKTVYHALKYKF